MLRRNQTLAVEMDAPNQFAEALASEPAAAAVPMVERRKNGDRRGMDALRAQALQNLITRVEDRNFNGLRSRVQWHRGIKPSRIILMLIAILAGGAAAVLATQGDQPAPAAVPMEQVVAPVMTRILVAKQAIGVGQRLSPDALEWMEWPEQALRTEYITSTVAPEAITDVAGAVARHAFFPGEPIREQKLLHGARGYLSAVLDPGMRGVSVSVAAESASGGFIVPNDHVDVVMTRLSGTSQSSEIILQNVRVLAINARLGESAEADPALEGEASANTEVFSNLAIATLALDPIQAEVIINATNIGKLSLVLRPTSDSGNAGAAQERAANAAIRISSPFWTKTAGGMGGE